MKYFLIVFIIFFLIFSSYIVFSKNDEGYKKIEISVKGENFVGDVSDTNAKRQLGLSFRKSIGDREAMIFIFENNGVRKFWMKDMLFPIDIIWLDQNKRVIHIEKNISPNTYPKSFGPETDSLYVIEFNAGTAEKLSLSIGDIIEFSI